MENTGQNYDTNEHLRAKTDTGQILEDQTTPGSHQSYHFDQFDNLFKFFKNVSPEARSCHQASVT